MLKENLIELYQKSFRENKELPALSDYFKKESFSYFEMAKEIAKLHLLFEEAGLQRGDKVALIGRNNPRWCIVYIATITYGAVIVPILQDFSPNDVHHIINHSESVLLFAGDIYWDTIETDNIEQVRAAFSLTDFHCLYERYGDRWPASSARSANATAAVIRGDSPPKRSPTRKSITTAWRSSATLRVRPDSARESCSR